jgi:iron complex transport system substrate-binding protein
MATSNPVFLKTGFYFRSASCFESRGRPLDGRRHLLYRKAPALLLLPLLLLLFTACSDDKDSDSQSSAAGNTAVSSHVQIKGTDGITVTFDAPPQRIVSLAPHATEIICAIGGGDSLVAVDKFANCPEGAKTKTEVDGFQPSVEAIAALKPDFVYMVFDPGDVAASLRRLNITVLNLDVPSSLDGVFEQIDLWGRILGKQDNASKLVSDMKRDRDAVLDKVKSVQQGPRYFHELDSELFTVRDDTFEGSLYKLLKAQNVASDADTPYPQLSTEAVVAKDPQVIVLLDGQTAADVKARPGWQNVSAVKNNKICVLDPDLLSRPGPHIVDGLESLEACLYGD